MEEPDFLTSSTIAFIGLGLMGGSLALALRGKCKKIVGIDPDPASRIYALEQNIIDQASDDPDKILPQANIVILAAPVSAIIQWINQLPAHHPGEAIVIDLGSTKREILQAMNHLPSRFFPVGGHPVCGKEQISIRNADADIFNQASFIFSPLKRTPEKAKQIALQLAEAIGSIALWLNADEHDRIMAATSHAPYLLASGLALATSVDFGAYIGTGFHSTARLAATPSSMMIDVLKSNRDNVVPALELIRDQIDMQLSALKADDFNQLQAVLDRSKQRMNAFLHQPD